ncbi:hypothetical protein AYI68_g380 [Smittium mucronatum]|uniref:SGF29 C-terminal domain-containing protein n=1 Tax=Smittium mucronatum TaxID=133383 RepID=A0A1R0H8E0_9FUNG|nr:hypothetical protein AYI68_g380 [Smittium mucronatum]
MHQENDLNELAVNPSKVEPLLNSYQEALRDSESEILVAKELLEIVNTIRNSMNQQHSNEETLNKNELISPKPIIDHSEIPTDLEKKLPNISTPTNAKGFEDSKTFVKNNTDDSIKAKQSPEYKDRSSDSRSKNVGYEMLLNHQKKQQEILSTIKIKKKNPFYDKLNSPVEKKDRLMVSQSSPTEYLEPKPDSRSSFKNPNYTDNDKNYKLKKYPETYEDKSRNTEFPSQHKKSSENLSSRHRDISDSSSRSSRPKPDLSPGGGGDYEESKKAGIYSYDDRNKVKNSSSQFKNSGERSLSSHNSSSHKSREQSSPSKYKDSGKNQLYNPSSENYSSKRSQTDRDGDRQYSSSQKSNHDLKSKRSRLDLKSKDDKEYSRQGNNFSSGGNGNNQRSNEYSRSSSNDNDSRSYRDYPKKYDNSRTDSDRPKSYENDKSVENSYERSGYSDKPNEKESSRDLVKPKLSNRGHSSSGSRNEIKKKPNVTATPTGSHPKKIDSKKPYESTISSLTSLRTDSKSSSQNDKTSQSNNLGLRSSSRNPSTPSNDQKSSSRSHTRQSSVVSSRGDSKERDSANRSSSRIRNNEYLNDLSADQNKKPKTETRNSDHISRKSSTGNNSLDKKRSSENPLKTSRPSQYSYITIGSFVAAKIPPSGDPDQAGEWILATVKKINSTRTRFVVEDADDEVVSGSAAKHQYDLDQKNILFVADADYSKENGMEFGNSGTQGLNFGSGSSAQRRKSSNNLTPNDPDSKTVGPGDKLRILSTQSISSGERILAIYPGTTVFYYGMVKLEPSSNRGSLPSFMTSKSLIMYPPAVSLLIGRWEKYYTGKPLFQIIFDNDEGQLVDVPAILTISQ